MIGRWQSHQGPLGQVWVDGDGYRVCESEPPPFFVQPTYPSTADRTLPFRMSALQSPPEAAMPTLPPDYGTRS
jgi:hypothetical protein